MRLPGVILLFVILATIGLGAMLWRRPAALDASSQGGSLVVFCAAVMRHPMVAIAQAYEKEYGTRIDLEFGGSGTLLSSLRLARRGDLFLAADASYIDIARREGLVDEAAPLARLRPVIAVARGNLKAIRTVGDLARADVRVALASPQAASVGQATQTLLSRMGLWPSVEAAVRDRGVFKTTVNEIASDVKLGAADAGIVWDSTVRQEEYAPSLEAIAIPGAESSESQIVVGVLHRTERPAAALHFASYLADPQRGLAVLARMGFTTVAPIPAETQPR